MVKVYADGADPAAMRALAERVAGFTTNPSLMKQAGITDYRAFAQQVLTVAAGKPVSFEVLSDEPAEMCRQAREISSWGRNVFVKIPVVHADGTSCEDVIATLAAENIKVNVTAVMTNHQVAAAMYALAGKPGIVSIFAGRIADTGRDPVATVRYAKTYCNESHVRVLWASTREVLNVDQADKAGADIITLTPALIEKLRGIGRDLDAYSVETVRQFHRDAEGITL